MIATAARLVRSPSLLAVPLLLALLMTVPVPGQTAAQTFNSALPVARDTFVYRQQFFQRRADAERSPSGRDLTVTGAISVLAHGLDSDLTLFAAVPWLDKSLRLEMLDDRHLHRGSSGFGDVRLFARYTLFQSDHPGSTFRIAPYLGIEAPTGDDDQQDGRGRLPRPLQPGSGSWDPFGGMVVTWQTLDYALDAQLAWQSNGEADGFEFGDILRVDAAAQYRILGGTPESSLPGFLYAAVEANLRHRGENRIDGNDDSDSGGTRAYLAPGLQYVTRRWVIEGVVQLPVYQDLDGAAAEDDFIVRLGFRVNF